MIEYPSNPISPLKARAMSSKPPASSSPQSAAWPSFEQGDHAAWLRAAAKSAPGGNVDALNWTTPDGIVVKPLYTAADTADLPYANTLPGFAPYVRGPQATMYAVRPWTIRQ